MAQISVSSSNSRGILLIDRRLKSKDAWLLISSLSRLTRSCMTIRRSWVCSFSPARKP